MTFSHIAILGVGGAIGAALVQEAGRRYPGARIHALRRPDVDYLDEESLAKSAEQVAADGAPDLVISALGILHDGDVQPEKAMRDISADRFRQVMDVNMIAPALIAKSFIPRMARDRRAVFAALSARVGSISDNRLGGWYAYRASKAALNMVMRNLAIESARQRKNLVIAGLHPGTVDSPLSKPFQTRLKPGQLFTPERSAGHLLDVVDGLRVEDSGSCFAWDGQRIEP